MDTFYKFVAASTIIFASPLANAQTAPAPGLSLSQQSLKDLGTCNYILSDQICISYLNKTEDEIIVMFGTPTMKVGDTMVYSGLGVNFILSNGKVRLAVFSAQMYYNSLIENRFIRRPGESLFWGANMTDTIALLGKPLAEKDFAHLDTRVLVYSDKLISFKNNQLNEIYYATDAHIKSYIGWDNTPAPPLKPTPPPSKQIATQAIVDEGVKVHELVLVKTKKANALVKEYNENMYLREQIFVGKGLAMKEQISTLRSDARKAINDYFKKYENVALPSELVERLNDDLSKLNGQQ